MDSNDIGDDGLAEISEALQHNKSLTTLRVGQCGLSVKGTVVCKMLGLQQIFKILWLP